MGFICNVGQNFRRSHALGRGGLGGAGRGYPDSWGRGLQQEICTLGGLDQVRACRNADDICAAVPLSWLVDPDSLPWGINQCVAYGGMAVATPGLLTSGVRDLNPDLEVRLVHSIVHQLARNMFEAESVSCRQTPNVWRAGRATGLGHRCVRAS